jgi:hypothetical protein
MKISFEGDASLVMREMQKVLDGHEVKKSRGYEWPIPRIAPFVGSTEQCQAVIRGAKTEDLQAELLRRDAIIPAPREVKFGPLSDAECEAAYRAWLVFGGEAIKSMRPPLEAFARSRGVL